MQKGTALVISSRPPHHSAGLGQTVLDCLEDIGYNADYLTLEGYPNMPKNVISLYPVRDDTTIQSQIGTIIGRIKTAIKRIAPRLSLYISNRKIKKINQTRISIRYQDEKTPGVTIGRLLSLIKKKYDVVISLFWQDMINSSSLKAISDKLNQPVILVYSPDMAPMTGGCFYFNNCRRFINGCGHCPGLNSQDPLDKTHSNYLLKKDNYSSMNCAFLGNSWMNSFAKDSKLFRKIYNLGIVIDEKVFIPGCKQTARKKLGINPKIEFILLIRSDIHPRKGNKDIRDAIELFLEQLNELQRGKCLVLTVGVNYFKLISSKLKCEVIDLGRVSIDTLVTCYQASSFFINASYDDAGPSMINQSIMCGTPVICYNNGVAMDVIEDGLSGYKVPTGEKQKLADCIRKGFDLSSIQYEKIVKSSRKIGLKHNCRSSVSSALIHIIKDMIGDNETPF